MKRSISDDSDVPIQASVSNSSHEAAEKKSKKANRKPKHKKHHVVMNDTDSFFCGTPSNYIYFLGFCLNVPSS